MKIRHFGNFVESFKLHKICFTKPIVTLLKVSYFLLCEDKITYRLPATASRGSSILNFDIKALHAI